MAFVTQRLSVAVQLSMLPTYIRRLSVTRVDFVQLDSLHAGEWVRFIGWLVARSCAGLVGCRHRVGHAMGGLWVLLFMSVRCSITKL